MMRTASPLVALPRWRAPLGERSDDYLDSLQRGGVRVVYLEPTPGDDAARQLANVAGLVLSGGRDVDPRLYGQRPHFETDRPCSDRDRYELALLEEALKRDLPVLAICRGHQLLNVMLGGKLIQHIPGDSHRAGLEPPRASAWHEVSLAADSRLAGILGKGRILVNSRHHQGVPPEMVANGLHATALSPDGLVEALEGEHQRWLVSVQWHPERPELAEPMAPLFAAFAEACRKGQQARRSLRLSFDRRRMSGAAARRLTRCEASARISPVSVDKQGSGEVRS